jgi:membrane-associated phospholipid phosphatase
MKNKKRNKVITFSLLGVFALISFIIVSIFDLKISKQFNTINNYFTVGFDFFGSNITTIVSYILIWNFLNYFVINRQSLFSYRAWMITFTILGSGILFMIFYFFRWTSRGLEIKNLMDQSSLIFGIPMIAATIIYALVIIFNCHYSKLIFAKYLSLMSAYGVMMILFAAITTFLLKEVVGRPRPREILGTGNENVLFRYPFQITFSGFRGSSFPSGHTNAACTMFVFVYFCSGRKKSHFIVTSLFVGGFVAATAVARILIHAHWTTDTMFAIIINFIWFFTAPLIVIRMNRPRRRVVIN